MLAAAGVTSAVAMASAIPATAAPFRTARRVIAISVFPLVERPAVPGCRTATGCRTGMPLIKT
jgi:hypothetical protein